MPALPLQPAHRDARFWDRIAAKYAARPIADMESYERKLEITRGFLRPSDRVLELGCGTGGTALAHAAYVAEILATDISQGMIEIARGKAAEAGAGNLRFVRAAVAELEIAPGSVDVVLALNLLHLLDDPQGTLARIGHWLKPGGVLVASTACVADIMPGFRFVAPPLRWLGLVPKIGFFSRRQLEAMYAAEGYRVERIWQPPGKRVALFMVARTPGESGGAVG